MARGHFNLEKVRKPVPFSKLAERYREFASGYKRGWQEEKYIVDEFANLFGETPLAQITTWQIEKWKGEQGKTLNLGFLFHHQRGSHIILNHTNGRHLSVPDHRELDRGTLRALIRGAGTTVEEFVACL